MAAVAKRVMEPVAVPANSKKGKKPDMSGVPGELVGMPAFELRWGGGKISPYDGLLEKLAAAGPGQLLKFGDARAKTSLWSRSRKLGMKLMYAEHEGSMYVKFAGWAPDSERGKQIVRAKIMEVLQTNPRTEIQLAVELRKQGLTDMDAATAGAILKQMEQLGQTSRKADGTWLAK